MLLLRVALRVGQNRIYTPYMTVYLVVSLPKNISYMHHIYLSIWLWPTLAALLQVACYVTSILLLLVASQDKEWRCSYNIIEQDKEW